MTICACISVIKPGIRFIVDNRSGASGALAVEAAVNANPDGHTIVLITTQAVGQAGRLRWLIRSEIVKWTKLVKAANIQMQ